MNLLLHLKAWQLFLLIAIPLLIDSDSLIFEIINLFGFCVYTAWIYAIGFTMHSLLPDNLNKPNISNFKIGCLTMIIAIFVGYSSTFLGYHNLYLSAVFVLIIFTSLFFSVGFAARMLESKLDRRIANRSDSLKNIFCILFFPIGIWIIQPLIKRVLTQEESGQQS
jgi:hypothetical protein